MDTVFLLVYILGLRGIFYLALQKPAVVKGGFLIFFFIFAAFAVPVPLMLIKKEVISNSVHNILIAGSALVYFAIVITRALGKLKRY
ncbi:hypothetical protein [Gilvimarinus agarilyticus]|uniref:hypothetical protein n=1 Tax=Gilvimarinus agarilyticus TaxID=679259 RepID=UPI0012FAE244|nr:hypothetical protein [Gilvimarinus agarilyticus]